MTLPKDAAARKGLPITTGVLDYFPDALAEVARVSKIGNDQHNPGQPLHWAKHKSNDEADALVRHLLERGTFDSDGTRHSAKVAWRALANLQREIEADEAVGYVAPLSTREQLEIDAIGYTPDEGSVYFDPDRGWGMTPDQHEAVFEESYCDHERCGEQLADDDPGPVEMEDRGKYRRRDKVPAPEDRLPLIARWSRG